MKIINRQARFDYKILETFEAGIVLTGAEVKSLRLGKLDLSNSYIRILNNEAYLINAYIYPYLGQEKDYDPRRTRKLLLHKTQLKTLIGRVSAKGKALVALSLYSKNNYFKVEAALAESKKKFDKRKELKEKDEQKRMEQEWES